MQERKTAIVTGGTRGIGLAIAKQLGLDGFALVVVGTKKEAEYPGFPSWFTQHEIPLVYIQANIAESDDRQKIVETALSCFGKIDVLVNNAGVAPTVRKDLLEMEEDSFDRLISINTKGPLFLSQSVAKAMLLQPRESRDCRIVFITSCSSVVSSPSRGEYCVSKAAASMVSTLFADRLASENILVHEIRPGVIRTDMTSGVTDKYETLFAQGVFPIKRWGEPEDVAQAVSVCCSGAFRYTTGNVIDVDGGFHIQRL
ncbi:3-ketoacyl-ACP reductase [uncultured Sphaerochaeta sp.]|uniref:3-ketoacyl-ACP reductase n=1 Tax=uncultured Sphaerochaeta sp. TaxID=886478 RepID=UPI002A0A117F|nr:3-ketoacyl-ACP reductase [uncultured Sphaerochaeta sp.]